MTKVIKIEGMSCEHCVKAVKKALSAVDGVNSADVDLENNQANLDVSSAVTDAMLRGAVEEAGYDVAEIA